MSSSNLLGTAAAVLHVYESKHHAEYGEGVFLSFSNLHACLNWDRFGRLGKV